MLRQAQTKDAEVIEAIRVAAWKVAYKDFMPAEFLSELNSSDRVEYLRERLSEQNQSYQAFVAEAMGDVQGFFVLGAPRYDTGPEVVELWALYVDPTHWHRRIGSALLNQAIVIACQSGYKQIELWCLKGNQPAQLTYERAGFHASGVERVSSKLTGAPLHEIQYVRRL